MSIIFLIILLTRGKSSAKVASQMKDEIESLKKKLQEAEAALAIEKRHWIEDDRDLNELIAERDQAIRERDEVKKLKSILPIHGCLTGDCPHDNANQCVEALKEYVAQMEQAELELQAEREQLIGVVDDAVRVAQMMEQTFVDTGKNDKYHPLAATMRAYSLLPHVIAKKGNK